MPVLKRIFFSLFLWSCLYYANARPSQIIDSLLAVLKQASLADTARMRTFNMLSVNYRRAGKYDSTIYYSQEAMLIARLILKNQGNDKRMAFVAKTSLAASFTMQGIAYQIQGNYPEALHNHYEALKLREALNDKQGIAATLSNLGLVYDNQGNYEKALSNHKEALRINVETGNKAYVAFNYNNIGNIYNDMGKHDDALKNYSLCLGIMKEMKNENGLATCYNNIGLVNEYSKHYKEAIENYFLSLEIRKKTNDLQGLAIVYVNLGSVHVKTGQLKEAAGFFAKGKELSEQTENLTVLTDCYFGITQLDSANKDWKSAFEHHKQYILYRDSVTNEQKTAESVQATLNYEFGKKEALATAEHERKIKDAEEKTEKQKTYFFIACAFLLAIAAFSFVLFRTLNTTRKQKKIIEQEKGKADQAYEILNKKNKEVLDSIYYARRIQQALMPSEKYILKSLNKQQPKNKQ